jgi:hypothetical protein
MREMTAPFNGLRRDITTIALICRDRRTPWHARLAAACCDDRRAMHTEHASSTHRLESLYAH